MVSVREDIAAPPRRSASIPATKAPASARRAVSIPLGLFFSSRALLAVLAVAVPLQAGQSALGRFGRLVDVADAQWYLRVAVHGYAHIPLATALAAHRSEDWVFFPLYPVTARVVGHLLGTSVLWTGVALSNLCFFGFVLVLYRWVSRLRGRRAAAIATALACFCPLAAYFTAFRAASLFLLLSAVCLERLSRRMMVQAAIAGGLASLTRPNGLLLVVPFLVVVAFLVRAPGSRRAGVRSLCFVPMFGSGAAVMAWVSARDAGTWLAFVRAQAAWGRSFRPPFAAFAPFFAHPVFETGFRWTSPPIALGATVLGLLAVALLVRGRMPPELGTYLLVTVLAATASTVLLGVPRFIAEAPPLYVAGGTVARRTGWALVVVSVALMAVYTTYWLLGAPWTMA